MADLFSNLLLRSQGAAKASGALLQPRLPSLFEEPGGAPGSADQISAPPADATTSSAQLAREAAVTIPAAAPVIARPPDAAQPAAPAPALQIDAHVVAPTSAGPVQDSPSVLHTHSVSPAQPANVPTSGPELRPLPIEPERTVSASRAQKTSLQHEPASKTVQLTEQTENGQSIQAGNLQIVTPKAAGRVLQSSKTPARRAQRAATFEPDALQHPPLPAQPVLQSASETERGDRTVRPVTSQPALKALLAPQPVAAARQTQSQTTQPAEAEQVVQVHIGRIEVRAITPPAQPQPAPAARPQPRLSLEDYLRQREEKR